MFQTCSLRALLDNPERFPVSADIYMDLDAVWDLETEVLVVESNEDIPIGMTRVLGVDAVQDIVINAREQRSTANDYDLLNAFLHYYDNDAFIVLT